jgi:glycosyltransferase involved in cell wall biosynthesis
LKNTSTIGNILMITPFLWSGAGKVIVRLLLELKRYGFECSIISSGRSRGFADWPEYIREIRRAGIEYRTIDFFDRDPARVWQSIERLTGFLEKHRIDIVHVHAGVPAFAASVSRDRLTRPFGLLATFHSWNPQRPAWMNVADVWALNRCDRVIAVSRSYQKELESWGLDSSRVETICPGIDLPTVCGHESSRRQPFRLLSLGRIEPRKDQETLLRAFSIFHRKYPKTELCIAGPAGDQDYADRLISKAHRYKWDHGVRFLGKVRAPAAWYGKSNLFVSTSTDEGLGLSLLEAMSHGMPALCTAVNGHIEFAEDGFNARLFQVGNADTAAKLMRELYLDAGKRARLGANARATVARGFTWDRVIEQYLEAYRALLETAGKPRILPRIPRSRSRSSNHNAGLLCTSETTERSRDESTPA